jgi:hypothetical protein
MRVLALTLLVLAAQAPRTDASSQRSVDVKTWKFPYNNGTFEITYSRSPDGTGDLDLWMEGGESAPGSRLQVPFLKSVLDDMQVDGIDPRSLRRIGSRLYLDDLLPLAIACVHSSDCRRTMELDRQKGGLQLSIKMLNEKKILSAYQDILTPYGLTFEVCDADSLFVKHFRDYGMKPDGDQRFANTLVPANLVVFLCVKPIAH